MFSKICVFFFNFALTESNEFIKLDKEPVAKLNAETPINIKIMTKICSKKC